MSLRSQMLWLMIAAGTIMGCADDETDETDETDGHDPTAPTGCELSPQVGHGRLEPLEEDFPTATGTCPGFVDGDGCEEDDTSLICDFHPAGNDDPRPVRIYMTDAAFDTDSGVVMFWHGLGSNPSHAVAPVAGMGPDVVADIVADGHIVAAPQARADRQNASFNNLPWLIAQGGSGDEDDLRVMDEVIACADEVLGVDRRRLHSTGMSAGGLHTGHVAPRRSAYLASVALFSGGRIGLAQVQDPDNKYPVIAFHGGPGDQVVIQFDDASRALRDYYENQGHFVVLCDHGADHTIPERAAEAAWQFLKDHPYGSVPTPYCEEMPEEVYDFCEY